MALAKTCFDANGQTGGFKSRQRLTRHPVFVVARSAIQFCALCRSGAPSSFSLLSKINAPKGLGRATDLVPLNAHRNMSPHLQWAKTWFSLRFHTFEWPSDDDFVLCFLGKKVFSLFLGFCKKWTS